MVETVSRHSQSACPDYRYCLSLFRNVIINILSTTLAVGQVSANIIGPLSTRFGQGRACIWPLAVAEVCGGLPADFNETALEERIAAGEENLTFGQLLCHTVISLAGGSYRDWRSHHVCNL